MLLQFAGTHFDSTGEHVKLIIIRPKGNGKKSAAFFDIPQFPENSSLSMRIEPVAEEDSTEASAVAPEAAPAPDNSEEALKWFREFLESYKREMIAEVTNEVLQRMTSAMLLSQTMDPAKSAPPRAPLSEEILRYLPGNPTKSTSMINDPSCMQNINALYRARGHAEFQKLAMGPKPPLNIMMTKVPKESNASVPGMNLPMSMPNSFTQEFPPESWRSPWNQPNNKRINYCKILTEKTTETTEASSPKSNADNCCAAKWTLEPILGKDLTTKKDGSKVEEVKAPQKLVKGKLIEVDDAKEIATNVGSTNNSELSDPKVNNQANLKSKSENIIVIDEENYELVHSEDAATVGNQGSRGGSISSFELVSESPSPTGPDGQPASPEKKSQKPIKSTPPVAPNDSNTIEYILHQPTDPGYPTFFSDSSEKVAHGPILEKRTGGTYSYIALNLPDPKENIASAKPIVKPKAKGKGDAKVLHPETGEFLYSATRPNLKGTPAAKGEKDKKSKPRIEIRINESKKPHVGAQSRQVLIDHNTSKGLGDTTRTCPGAGPRAHNDSRRPQGCFAGISQDDQYYRYGPPCAPNAAYYTPNDPFPGNRYIPEFGQWSGHPGQHANDQWNAYYQYPGFYPYSTDPMQILPETLISGAVQAASSAYTTARKVIDKIRSPVPDPPCVPKPRKL